MGRRVLLASALAVALAGNIAAANHQPSREFETAKECSQSGGFGLSGGPTCSRVGDGPWVATYGHPSSGAGGAFAGVIVFALLWAAAPAVISGVIASDRGQSVGLAVLIGLILGWIGLLIVIFAFKEDVARAARNTIGAAAARPPLPTDTRPTSERLAELDRLRSENLITEAEYTRRRERILDQI